MGIFDLFKKNKDVCEFINTETNVDAEPIEVFMNENENKCGENYDLYIHLDLGAFL